MTKILFFLTMLFAAPACTDDVPACQRVNSTACDYDYPGAGLVQYECGSDVDLSKPDPAEGVPSDCFEGDGLICCAPGSDGAQ